jgi:hypothetical protein
MDEHNEQQGRGVADLAVHTPICELRPSAQDIRMGEFFGRIVKRFYLMR